MSDVIKYPRGCIYEVRMQSANDASDTKSSPKKCMILFEGGTDAKTVVVALILAKTDKLNDFCVPITHPNGNIFYVACDRIHTVSVTTLGDKCYGKLTDSVMSEVSNKCAEILGIQREPAEISSLHKLLDKIAAIRLDKLQRENALKAEGIIKQLTKQVTEIADAEAIERIKIPNIEAIEDLEVEPEPALEPEPVLEPQLESESHSDSESEPTIVYGARKPRDFWTDDRKRDFIWDKENSSIEAVKDKWGINKTSSIYQYYYKFKKEIGM